MRFLRRPAVAEDPGARARQAIAAMRKENLKRRGGLSRNGYHDPAPGQFDGGGSLG